MGGPVDHRLPLYDGTRGRSLSGPADTGPIFVVGCPRSGTSMMQWALRAHPDVWGSAESDFLVPLIEGTKSAYAFGIKRDRMHWLVRESVTESELLASVGTGIDSLYASRAGGRRWVEQTPLYSLHLRDVAAMFPDARFVAMVRDGRDVVHSLMHFVQPMSHRAACRTFQKYTRAVLDFCEADNGVSLSIVRYETAVAEPGPELARVCEFLGLTADPACGEYISTEAPINSSFDGPAGAQPRWATWTPAMFKYFHDVAGESQTRLGYSVTESAP